jgi:RNA polymerase sigma-70 factor, ECF subfamily
MRLADAEIQTLIRRSQAGDQSAFADLFHGCKQMVFRTAFLMLGNDRDAEDVLQDVFLAVYRELRNYKPERAAFSTWLYRITLNDCLNWKRKHRLPLLSIDDVDPPGESGIRDQDYDVWRAVSRLSSKLRAVVVLRYYSDLSYLEISEVLGIPLGTVKSRLNQALIEVRDELAPLVGTQRAIEFLAKAKS